MFGIIFLDWIWEYYNPAYKSKIKIPTISKCGMCCVLSHVWFFAIPWTIAHQPPLSMEFSRQEYWSGLSFPSPPNMVYIHLIFISSKFDGIIYLNQLWVSKMDILFGVLVFSHYFFSRKKQLIVQDCKIHQNLTLHWSHFRQIQWFGIKTYPLNFWKIYIIKFL